VPKSCPKSRQIDKRILAALRTAPNLSAPIEILSNYSANLVAATRGLLRHVDSAPAYRSIVAQQTEFAYKQHQTALKEMRSSLPKSTDTRKVLIGCLLVCCFESLIGNLASAHAQ
jgi:hypothetical protein